MAAHPELFSGEALAAEALALAGAVRALSDRALSVAGRQHRDVQALATNNALLIQALLEAQNAEISAKASQLHVVRASERLAQAQYLAKEDAE
jgi:hypothetical protein